MNKAFNKRYGELKGVKGWWLYKPERFRALYFKSIFCYFTRMHKNTTQIGMNLEITKYIIFEFIYRNKDKYK